MSHHDLIFHHTRRQDDNSPPSSLPGVVVAYDEPLLVDLPAVRAQLIENQARLGAMTIGANQDEAVAEQADDAEPDEEGDAGPDNPTGDEGANV